MNSKCLFLLLLCCSCFGAVSAKTTVHHLRVNAMTAPIGLDAAPLFSWEIASSDRNVLQHFYRIQVYKKGELVWDSGDVASSASNHIRYTGVPLEASTLYSWDVTVGLNSGKRVKSASQGIFQTGLLDSGWSGAQWITYDNRDSVFKKNQRTDKTVMFRSGFTINKPVKSAVLYTTSIGIHDLFLNGRRVGRITNGNDYIYDELKPGWTDVRKTVFYLTYNVTDFLKQGGNAVGAVVSSGWASGEIAHNRYLNPFLSYKAKLIITYEDDTREIKVTNTKDWKSSIDGPWRMADIYAGEDYDARRADAWTTAGFDDGRWHAVREHTEPVGKLIAHIGTPVQVRKDLQTQARQVALYKGTKDNGTDYGEIHLVREIKPGASINLQPGETVILDFGQNLVGWTPIRLHAKEGTKITLRYAEMLNDSGEKRRGNDGPKGTIYTKNLRKARAAVHYTASGSQSGESYRPSMTWFGFRYVEISTDREIDIQDIHAEVISSVGKEKSFVSTNDENVNKLFSNTLWGQRGNFISVPLDCPQRNERMGWLADAQVFARTAMYNANDVVPFYQKWMGDVRDAQDDDGAFPTIAPQTWGSVGKAEAAWADAGIIVPWIVYEMSGNTTVLEENYAAMTRHMDHLRTLRDDSYEYNGGGTKYGDWLAYDETDKRFMSVCYYAYDALLMTKAASALGILADEAKYTQLFEAIKDEFNQRYLTAQGSLSENTQTGYLYALKLGLFPTAEDSTVAVQHLVKLIADNDHKLTTGFLGTAILCQTLSEIGQSDMAYNLLLQRDNPSWLYSVDQGATTIWERWNSYTLKDGFGDARMNSFNHYAYGAVVEWMYAYLAGIKTDGSGFRKILIEPQLDLRKKLPAGQERITEVRGQYDSVNGKIKSAWKVEGSKVTFQVEIPANTTAKFILPKGVHGLPKTGRGVHGVYETDNKQVIVLGSGSYTFRMKLDDALLTKN